MRKRCILSIGALVALSAAGCGEVSLTSRAKDRDITVDGRLSDWRGVQFVGKEGLSFALMNDDTHVYAVVIARDRAVRRQLMLSGLYLWFDEKGGKEKNFGVCFPVGGLESEEFGMGPRGPRGAPDGTRAMRPASPDSVASPPGGLPGAGKPPSWGADSLAGRFPEAIRQMMVYSAKRDEWEESHEGSLGGVDVAADVGRTALVLEFRIPLERDPSTGYGIGAPMGQTVGIGVESPEIQSERPGWGGEPPEGDFGSEGGGSPGGPRGAGGGPPGGVGGRSRGMGGPSGDGGGRPEAIKVWGRLTFAGWDES
jgi:hypothetical protein